MKFLAPQSSVIYDKRSLDFQHSLEVEYDFWLSLEMECAVFYFQAKMNWTLNRRLKQADDGKTNNKKVEIKVEAEVEAKVENKNSSKVQCKGHSQSKNPDLIEVVDKTINDEALNDKHKRSIVSSSDDKNDGNQTDDSNKSSQVSANENDSTLLHTNTRLENDNKTFQKELSEIKDAIGSSDKSLKAVSSNKKGHSWIDVYISYITEDYTNIQQKNKLKRLPCIY
ncbi:hypothetical protein GLOIN_2v1784662 [Rhizophagus irregularis DAOM 181602=DAOM 197198]|uniref:Uncharacterized protein n=1 Tax=Rhizophagus irregularis (strain DAOM 181602 / DAOM 197198 / MUCL 43194) TaxID=747089 RepID=A0A2P4PC55_RHIID|nr:hypothetical protein GLOIN_2v1784662 [Rhizophagus irregularis DAOM 181602=DAOM 197198]POG62979.1 hypothetical protein GLOIN_2v1784662 [Rhizophagus irregularis DAOM 181602=DAOM 197198]|eukprot:XP_025169845.1 hypothetical protein GLOIN_2v1784662 [Rhizophagus irregularis DAOM 181602=DAOM 197198]